MIGNLNDHSIKIKLTSNVKLKNIYVRLIALYAQMRNYDMRVKCAKKHLEMCSELEGEDSLDIAYLYHRLATAYFEMNEPKEAISCLEKALSILLKMDKKNNPLLKVIYKTMGPFTVPCVTIRKLRNNMIKPLKLNQKNMMLK